MNMFPLASDSILTVLTFASLAFLYIASYCVTPAPVLSILLPWSDPLRKQGL